MWQNIFPSKNYFNFTQNNNPSVHGFALSSTSRRRSAARTSHSPASRRPNPIGPFALNAGTSCLRIPNSGIHGARLRAKISNSCLVRCWSIPSFPTYSNAQFPIHSIDSLKALYLPILLQKLCRQSVGPFSFYSILIEIVIF